MFATDFLFDGKRASDFGLMICSFSGEIEAASGGEIEYNVSKTPGRDKFTFYGAQLNSVIEWNFSICKDPRNNGNPYFSRYEESGIMKWLLKTDGYKPLQFKQPGYEDIFYNVYFKLTPHQIGGQTAGFDLTATSDCAYGFTDVITRKAVINASTPLELHIHSDINTYILPHVTLNQSGNFFIRNQKYIKPDIPENSPVTIGMERLQNISETIFTGISNNTPVIMDSDTDTIYGLTDPQTFNWHFLRLADGINIITTNSASDIEIEIRYREPRFVRI